MTLLCLVLMDDLRLEMLRVFRCMTARYRHGSTPLASPHNNFLMAPADV